MTRNYYGELLWIISEFECLADMSMPKRLPILLSHLKAQAAEKPQRDQTDLYFGKYK